MGNLVGALRLGCTRRTAGAPAATERQRHGLLAAAHGSTPEAHMDAAEPRQLTPSVTCAPREILQPFHSGLQNRIQDVVNQCYFRSYDDPQIRLGAALAHIKTTDPQLVKLLGAWPSLSIPGRNFLTALATSFSKQERLTVPVRGMMASHVGSDDLPVSCTVLHLAREQEETEWIS